MSQFETFSKTLAARSREPRLTIQRRGTITMNAAAFAELGAPEAVELLYDRDSDLLGLRACEPSLEHAAFVRPSTTSRNGPYVVSAMAFLRHYEIDTSVARRFPVRMRRSVLCAELTGPSDVVSKDAVGKDAVGKDAINMDAVGKDAISMDAVGKDAISMDAVGMDAGPHRRPRPR